MTSTPEAKAVARQPNCCIDQATAGTKIPPSARPRVSMDSARARFFSNQWMSATLIGKNPHMLEPRAMTMKAPYKPAIESIWLNSMKPTPNRMTPARIMPCEPKRSMIQPSSGPIAAASRDCMAAAPDRAVLLQPRSSVSTAR